MAYGLETGNNNNNNNLCYNTLTETIWPLLDSLGNFNEGGAPLPQFCGYRVNPAASCGGILPRARVRLGTGHGEGTVVVVVVPVSRPYDMSEL